MATPSTEGDYLIVATPSTGDYLIVATPSTEGHYLLPHSGYTINRRTLPIQWLHHQQKETTSIVDTPSTEGDYLYSGYTINRRRLPIQWLHHQQKETTSIVATSSTEGDYLYSGYAIKYSKISPIWRSLRSRWRTNNKKQCSFGSGENTDSFTPAVKRSSRHPNERPVGLRKVEVRVKVPQSLSRREALLTQAGCQSAEAGW